MYLMCGVENRGGILIFGINLESIFFNFCMQGFMFIIVVMDEWGEKFVGQGGLI